MFRDRYAFRSILDATAKATSISSENRDSRSLESDSSRDNSERSTAVGTLLPATGEDHGILRTQSPTPTVTDQIDNMIPDAKPKDVTPSVTTPEFGDHVLRSHGDTCARVGSESLQCCQFGHFSVARLKHDDRASDLAFHRASDLAAEVDVALHPVDSYQPDHDHVPASAHHNYDNDRVDIGVADVMKPGDQTTSTVYSESVLQELDNSSPNGRIRFGKNATQEDAVARRDIGPAPPRPSALALLLLEDSTGAAAEDDSTERVFTMPKLERCERGQVRAPEKNDNDATPTTSPVASDVPVPGEMSQPSSPTKNVRADSPTKSTCEQKSASATDTVPRGTTVESIYERTHKWWKALFPDVGAYGLKSCGFDSARTESRPTLDDSICAAVKLRR